MILKGIRLPDGSVVNLANRGVFWRAKDFIWYFITPNGHYGSLDNHEVEEHEDGMITVSPSIRVSDNTGELWHGYLEHGIWREC